MKFKVENLVKLYRSCTTTIPVSKGAFLWRNNENLLSLQSYWSIHNLEQAERSTFAINYSVQTSTTDLEDRLDINQIGFPTELGAETLSTVSNNGLYRATIRRFNDKKGEKKQILEIWSSKSKLKTFDLASFDIHGDICEDGTFGSVTFSEDCKKLLYIAERKKPKAESFFSQKKKTEPTTDETASAAAKTEKGIGRFYEEWGEQLVGRHNPAPFVFNVDEETIEEVSAISEEYSCGQAIWGPNDESLVFVAWPNNPRRLGLIFCPIRPNKIFSFNIKTKELVALYEDDKWCSSSPRLSPDGKCLVFLNNLVGGPHKHCSRLLKYEFSTSLTSVIVDVVQAPKKSEFPGLFLDELPVKCWASDNSHIFLTTYWKSKHELLSVNTKTNSIERLTNEVDYPSWSVLDIYENYIVASRSSPSLRPHIVLARFCTENGAPKLGSWHHVEPISSQILPDIQWTIRSIQPDDTEDESMEYEYIILRPLDAPSKVPVIVYPHGGPHSVVSPQFVYNFHMFLKLGFALVVVNYRGSIGFGETPLTSLLGKAGFQDVKDVQAAIEHAISQESWMDESKVAVVGGSHGGFLATHLIGQYPEFYAACICLNPVTDLRGKLETSDIPDWGWAEAGLAEHSSLAESKSYAIASPNACKEFWERSSVQYIPRVKTPVLMLLGKSDLRVPPTQGLNYYYALKAHGKVDARLFVYEDNHSISKIENFSDSTIRTILFLAEKLNLTNETVRDST